MPVVEPTEETIRQAAEALERGALVAFPTETVYGLGADARNGKAVAQIFSVKGRPQFNPLIVHVKDLETAKEIGVFDPLAEKLAMRFWPGPLTLVVPKKKDSGLSDLVTAGLDSVGIRVPNHLVAQHLLNKSGMALAAPSANRSGHVSPTSAEHVYEDLGDRPAFILDGGSTQVGLESTIVGFDREAPELLRSGGISVGDIEAQIGPITDRTRPSENAVRSPGQLLSHYAPLARLRLNVSNVLPGEGYLAFGDAPNEPTAQTINLSERGDLVEAASNLFAALRYLDGLGLKHIAVAPIPRQGLGAAINDRLERAAAPRGHDDAHPA